MLFLKYECKLDKEFFSNGQNRESKSQIGAKSEAACEPFQNAAQLCYVKAQGAECMVVGVYTAPIINKQSCDDILLSFLRETSISGGIESCDEITENELLTLLHLAERNSFLRDDEIFAEKFKLRGRYDRSGYYSEAICKLALEKENALQFAAEYCCGDTLIPEILRIFKSKYIDVFKGHPVQYIVRTTAPDLNEKVVDLLIASLYGKRRIISKRYTFIDCDRNLSNDFVERIYSLANGGTVVLRFDGQYSGNNEYADNFEHDIEILTKVIKTHGSNVLTIFCGSSSNNRIYDRFRENLPGVAIVEISEDAITTVKAKKYLKQRAKEKGIQNFRGLFTILNDENKNFTIRQLDYDFACWYDKHLRTHVFPQYASLSVVEASEKKAKGNAYQDLTDMIGLDEPKRIIEQAIDYYKARKMFADHNAFSKRPSLHMVFTGHPGTAKTTVARLFAKIMYDNKLLTGGQIVEVGRADLVGKYVGWTAQVVQEKFKAAKGGVLFIDEAYSLVDERKGLYGDEAINTIVQEMENLRDDIVVIFAGYPDEMEEFLSRNPGLSSRIAFHINFPDYTPDELLQISELLALKSGRHMSEQAKLLLNRNFKSAVCETNFGNGRYVRNVLEKAMMRQASRLVRTGYEQVCHSHIEQLEAEDFELTTDKKREVRSIGFQ